MTTFHLGLDTPSDHRSRTPQPPTIYDYSANPSSDEDSDEDNLPYPPELARSSFLTPTFNPSTYLSSLRNRHQTLEDLRADLRARSQLLNQELLDLVNSHYEEFLSLGGDLKGGEEKVEGVRVGLLGFEREVEGLRRSVRERVEEVGRLVRERREVWRGITLGRGLVEVERGAGELERLVGVKGKEDVDVEDDEEFSDDEDESVDGMGEMGGTVRRLRRHTLQFVLLERSIERLGAEHPFLQSLRPRMDELRRTLLLDLGAALKQAKANKAQDAVLALARMYADLGAEQEGIKALKVG